MKQTPLLSSTPDDELILLPFAIPELNGCHRICKDFWLSDGNVVLLSGTCVFKVHRGHLARHSDVFKDLFSIPQPEEQPHLYGLPFVELYDNPSDVYCLLRALYDGLYFRKPFPKDFPFLAGVLRLSTKYMIENLRTLCIAHLQCNFPLTLEGWDQREKAATDANGRYGPRDSIPNPILVINLARELDLEFLLPAAFYDLARYGASKTAMGAAPQPPPFPPAVPTTSSDPSPPPEATSIPSHVFLSHEDLVTTFRGREAAQRTIAAFISKELTERPISPSCLHQDDDSGRQCHESFYFITLNTLRSVGGIASGRDADPLFTLLQTIDMLHRTDFSDGERLYGLRLCCFCKLDFATAVNRARAELWKEIPAWFELENFQKLCQRVRDESQNQEGWILI
ncbi:hypothetical protein EW146_g5936 [Bondarzewia mesenterica]|uniref:BTB domain-containing protein n=1 Tax=Bondarzewia mesenterica TaxID=1095465 RepID=A0A4S4LS25_9AGAM|nr:hypothetical protein EW146_g5936 [Bondarzewia mesenterica]